MEFGIERNTKYPAVRRGSATDPHEAPILAEVALPLVHDQLATWDGVRPDILQRMLLAGIAIASPADAAALHLELLGNVEQAKKQLARPVFKKRTPIRDLYREMSLKSAAYRRPGRGPSWQRAWWLDGDDAAARALLETVLGPLAGRAPDA